MQGVHLAAPLADLEIRLPAIAIGVVLLLLGRRLFWLCVGIVGFLTVYQLSLESFHVESSGQRLAFACLAGLFGVLLAIFVQKIAVGFAGFLMGIWAAGSFLGLDVSHGANVLSARPAVVVAFLLAGLLAAVLAVRLFGIALVALSSLAGAGLIVDAGGVAEPIRPLLFVLLTIIGIAIQSGWMGRRTRER